MGYYRKWQPSAAKKREFAKQMNEIDDFCNKHNISQSASSDSYYFRIGDTFYRVSNHAVESRRNGMPTTRRDDEIYIHASKTRIIEIYNKIILGIAVDGRGNTI